MIPFCVDVTEILSKSVTMDVIIYRLHRFGETSVTRIDTVYCIPRVRRKSFNWGAKRYFVQKITAFISENVCVKK